MTTHITRDEVLENVRQAYSAADTVPRALWGFLAAGGSLSIVVSAVVEQATGRTWQPLVAMISVLGLTVAVATGTPFGKWLVRRRMFRELKKSGTPNLPAWAAQDPNFPAGKTYLENAGLSETQLECARTLAGEHEGSIEDLIRAVRTLTP